MHLAVSTWSFHRELPTAHERIKPSESVDLPGFLDLARDRWQVAGVELWSWHLLRPEDTAYLADVAAALRERGLALVNIACDHGKVGVADPATRRENLETLRRWVDTAAALGSRAIRVNTGAAEGRSDAETLAAVVEDYRSLLAPVRERGLALLLENHGGLSSDPAMVGRIFEGVGDPAFRACPDNGNFPPEVRDRGLRAMVPYMAMAHLKMLEFDDAGNEANFDIPAVVGLYRDAGFDGFLSIEFEGKGDQYEGVEKAVSLAKRCLA